MNFLAHCFLSGADEAVLVGNFIGDYVKGRAWEQYPEGIRRGILLHRAIDAFTDEHPAVRRSVARLRPLGGRYTAPVVDLLYDHLLSVNWPAYSDEPLTGFTARVYDILTRHTDTIPSPLRERLPFMLEARFLDEYGSREEMYRALARFSRRIPLEEQGRVLLDGFFAGIDAYAVDFREFFPELMRHVL